MPFFNVATELGGLFGFYRRYGELIQEIIDAFNGFSTDTPGAYNPVNYPDRWKNVKVKPYDEESFEFNVLTPLTVNGVNRFTHKNTKLNIIKKCMPIQNEEYLNVCRNVSVENNFDLNVIKRELFKEKRQKLNTLSKIIENITNPLTLYKHNESDDHTPLEIHTWLKTKKSIKLGVLSWMRSKRSDRLYERIYMLEDVGTISEIEMIELIKEVEQVAK